MALREKRFAPSRQIDPRERDAVLAILRDRLFTRPEVVFAYVHGSFGRSEPFRDIDVGLFVQDERGFSYESDLSHDLSREVGADVDARIVNSAPVAFQMAVLRDGVLLFSRNEDARTDFIESVSKRFSEYAHFRNLFLGLDGAGHKQTSQE